jgi:uncharacterized protein YegL
VLKIARLLEGRGMSVPYTYLETKCKQGQQMSLRDGKMGHMKKSLTELVFILDRSGSMESLSEQAIAGFNAFLKDQQQAPGSARLTLVLFDNEYLKPVDAIPVCEVVPLTAATYEPRGTTALLDAIGQTIDEVGARLSETGEKDRPATVIVAILTDGLENASRKYSWRDVSERIKHQTETYKWEFMFLGANQDAIATAANLNIDAKNASGYAADGIGLHASTAAMSKKSRALRAFALHAATPADLSAIEEPMSDAVAEEDRKRRS